MNITRLLGGFRRASVTLARAGIPRVLAIFLLLGLCSTADATIVETGFTEATYGSSVGDGVTSMAWAPDGSNRLFVVRQGGAVHIIKNGVLLSNTFAVMNPVEPQKECGLLGIAFDPNFSTNHFVYFFVTVAVPPSADAGGGEQQIIRYTDSNDVGTNRRVMVPNLPTRGENHNGGALAATDGKLYFAVGDNGGPRGVNEDLTTLASKLSRVNLDGSDTTSGNPFPSSNAKIFGIGFRNPYSIAVQPGTGALWLNVVGSTPQSATLGYEQVFIVDAGAHGGWIKYEADQPSGAVPGLASAHYIRPVIAYPTSNDRRLPLTSAVRSGNVSTFTTNDDHLLPRGTRVEIKGVGDGSFNGFVFVASVPSARTFTAQQTGANATSSGGEAVHPSIGSAMTGGCFYSGSAFPAAYTGNFFFGDFITGRIMRARVSGSTVSAVDVFATGASGYIDCETGPDGALYYALHGGRVVRVGTSGTPVQQTLIVSPTTLNMIEGDTAAFNVRLGTRPSANVTVTLAKTGDASVSLTTPTSLTFTPDNFQTLQTVRLQAAQDANTTNGTASVAVSSAGVTGQTVGVNVTDDDRVSIIVSTTALTVNEGAMGTIDVSLSNQPSADTQVMIALSGQTAGFSLAPSGMLTFTTANWNTAQHVVVTAVEDDTNNMSETGKVTFSSSGLTSREVNLIANDDEPAPPSFTSTPDTTAIEDAPYSYDVNATGTPAPTYELSGTVPAGMTINATTGVISWTPAMVGDFPVTVIAKNPTEVMQPFTIKVTADQKPNACPVTLPKPGDVVSSAVAEFFGDGGDDVGAIKAEFYVDGVLGYTDNAAGHFHFGGQHASWDTTQYSDGPHTLRFVVYDRKNQTCMTEVPVEIDNSVPLPPDGGVVTDGPTTGTDGQPQMESDGGVGTDGGANFTDALQGSCGFVPGRGQPRSPASSTWAFLLCALGAGILLNRRSL